MSSLVVYGVSHVDLPVLDLGRALKIYQGVLGFEPRMGVPVANGVPPPPNPRRTLDLETGTINLRLLLVRRVERRAALRLQAAQVDLAFEALVTAGCKPVSAIQRTEEREWTATVQDPDGHSLHLWRALTEDEYDTPPELPIEMRWAPDADALLKSLLRSVPALFRGLARRKVVRVAEELASGQGWVTREEVIRGLILASPRVTRGRNRGPLVEHGIDVERYRADWDAD